MSILKYITDKEYDTEMIYHMVKSGIYKNSKDASKQMGLGLALVKKITKAESISIVKNELKGLADKKYQQCGDYLKRTVGQYQKSWDEIDKKFFERLEELLGAKIGYKNYYCVVSLFHNGISNWNGNKIVRHWDRNPYTQRRITAHEIIIAHFFNIVRRMKTIYPDNEIWKLAEVYAFAITGLDRTMRSFWPWDKSGNYTDHNYPELVEYQKKLQDRAIKSTIGEFVNMGLNNDKSHIHRY